MRLIFGFSENGSSRVLLGMLSGDRKGRLSVS